ncbi:uncharacterized protein LOC130782544 isoform X1 [Actinidia eriantha]|uniref:uncharacterized protein LOC130782544 isoform X1 n=2 Tax=Actinidia eriantha TaxID=165200 RepID=UPI002587F0CE|nr:uncharacterized protein LOC130782544 isoform X1 [Actinidia eriantha]XP_057497877.1 uncharacterized protein LOC130782544 isoform X1 [Actinidia eriantha]
MLIQSSLHGSIEGPLSFVSDHGKGDWLSGAETWQKCPKWERNPLVGSEEFVPIIEGKRKIDDLCSLNFASSWSLISTASIMSENSTPAFVYRRRKLRSNSVSVFPSQASTNPSGGCLSAISCEAPSVVGKEGHIVSVVELESEVVGTPAIPPFECNREVLISKSESINGCLVGGEPGSKEAPKSDTNRVLDFCCINDSYSSSKSNVEPGSASLRTEVDDTGECSSSGALLVESLQDDPSEKDICISILRSQGLLEGVFPKRIHNSAESPGTNSDNSCIWTCKVCDHPETTRNMLICDQCEEAFHLSCCNPRMKKITVDEWFCHSCLKKKHKILKENSTSKARNTRSEVNGCRNATSEGELGPIASMLIDTEPYYNSVRIGQDFQAEVPDWCGPTFDEVDIIGELLEIGPSESVSLHGRNSSKSSRLSSIGNWLQCREIIEGVGEGVDGTICGKWRRAPLFEVQTDDWECFCAVLWDPAHADCAVPQELDTDQVLKQLKYIEMLRPRLVAKRRKLDLPKNDSSQDLAEDARTM